MIQTNQESSSNASKLLKQLPSNNSLRKKKSGQFKPSEASTLSVFDKLFIDAQGAMTTEEDKESLSVLKNQLTGLIGTTLGAEPFLHPPKLPSPATSEKEEKKNPWKNTKNFYRQMKEDLFGGKRPVESKGARSEKSARSVSSARSEKSDGEDYKVARRRSKKKSTVSSSSRPHGFQPRRLERLSEDAYCIPLFFPSEESYEVFHSALSSAKRTLYVCIFSLTDNDTAKVLSDAYQRGLDVRIITDNDQMDPQKGADVCRLHERFGIPYKYDNSDQFMHNKFAVIDDKIVITGSFNWSAGARYKNRENVVITNIPSMVEAYAKEFDDIWDSF